MLVTARRNAIRPTIASIPFVLCLVVALAIGGCEDERPDADRGRTNGTQVRPSDTEVQEGGGVVETKPIDAPASVDVHMKEFEIRMPTVLKPGPVLLKVTNDGSEPHGFTVTGNGMDISLPTNVQPGETQTLPIDLAPGSYRAFCPNDGHVDRGMAIDVAVSE